MGRFFKFLVRFVVIAALFFGAIYIALEGSRRHQAVGEAVKEALAGAEESTRVAVEKAVAKAEARLKAEAPSPLPKIETKLDADAETRGLFPDGAFLMEVSGKYQQAKCDDTHDVVNWVRIEPDGRRSAMERYTVSPMRAIGGLLTFLLTEPYEPAAPVQTIFSAKTEGPYTTFILGALRDDADEEVVAPQIRLTLYRLDTASFGVVERAPVNEPPAARPANRAPKFSKVLRRCAYQGGVTEL